MYLYGNFKQSYLQITRYLRVPRHQLDLWKSAIYPVLLRLDSIIIPGVNIQEQLSEDTHSADLPMNRVCCAGTYSLGISYRCGCVTSPGFERAYHYTLAVSAFVISCGCECVLPTLASAGRMGELRGTSSLSVEIIATICRSSVNRRRWMPAKQG